MERSQGVTSLDMITLLPQLIEQHNTRWFHCLHNVTADVEHLVHFWSFFVCLVFDENSQQTKTV